MALVYVAEVQNDIHCMLYKLVAKCNLYYTIDLYLYYNVTMQVPLVSSTHNLETLILYANDIEKP